MQKEIAQISIGALLHDIGKIIQRSNLDRREHSLAGYEMLKDTIKDKDILECIRYHHESELKKAKLDNKSIAYLVCLADNIAAGTDRRDSEDKKGGYQKNTPLYSIYNLINNCREVLYYDPTTLNQENKIAFPHKTQLLFDDYKYRQIWQGIKGGLKSISYDEMYVNSLLSLLESWSSYVPSSTVMDEVPDISLYDHVKITAAAAGCLYLYLTEQERGDFKKEALSKKDSLMAENAFLLFSCDLSGIQDFIYTTGVKGALKTLRARSLYLEIFLEHVMDELLEKVGLSRANLIYTGGGHAYALLPNSESCLQILHDFKQNINSWLLEEFDTDLYLACAWTETSGNVLCNKKEGKEKYKKLFSILSQKLSMEKSKRYNASDLIKLNHKNTSGERECRNCRRSSKLKDNDLCEFCSEILYFSKTALKKDCCFAVTERKINDTGVLLPTYNGTTCYLKALDRESMLKYLKQSAVKHFYSKNSLTIGTLDAGHIWMGDYNWQKDDEIASFEELAAEANGIKRIGILRADVDNLGEAFAKGFYREQLGEEANRYLTLSRSAALSRSLAMFFKFHLNSILAKKDKSLAYYELSGEDIKKEEGRKVHIIYSGGDDLFLVGAWGDVLSAGIDIYKYFQKYTQGMLSLSAGFGIYGESVPLLRLAKDTGQLEEQAKSLPGKNAIALFTADDEAYTWQEFTEDIIEKKLRFLQKHLQNGEENATFIYALVQLLKDHAQINIAKIAYTLGRRQPDEKADDVVKAKYNEFSSTIYGWAVDKSERKRLALAGQIYIYLNRNGGRKDDE